MIAKILKLSANLLFQNFFRRLSGEIFFYIFHFVHRHTDIIFTGLLSACEYYIGMSMNKMKNIEEDLAGKPPKEVLKKQIGAQFEDFRASN